MCASAWHFDIFSHTIVRCQSPPKGMLKNFTVFYASRDQSQPALLIYNVHDACRQKSIVYYPRVQQIFNALCYLIVCGAIRQTRTPCILNTIQISIIWEWSDSVFCVLCHCYLYMYTCYALCIYRHRRPIHKFSFQSAYDVDASSLRTRRARSCGHTRRAQFPMLSSPLRIQVVSILGARLLLRARQEVFAYSLRAPSSSSVF